MASTPIYRGNADPLGGWRQNASVRAIAALMHRGDIRQAAEKLYGGEAEAVLKASVNPASTTGWGSQAVERGSDLF